MSNTSDVPTSEAAHNAAPFISVITVVYNNRDGFRETALSVLDQTDASYEWIVIDGGSTDGTVDEIRRNEARIAYWVSERDCGIYDAMNKGLARSRGEFIVFMNSGDRLAEPETLKRVTLAIDTAPSDIGMVLGGARFELREDFSFVQMPRPLDPYIRHSLPTSHQATFFRRSLHQQVAFETTIRIAADYDVMCRMFKINPSAAYIYEVVALVDRSLQSNSLKYPLQNIRDMAATQRRVLGLGRFAILVSALRRVLPAIAFRLLANRWTSVLTARVISRLRPVPTRAPKGLRHGQTAGP